MGGTGGTDGGDGAAQGRGGRGGRGHGLSEEGGEEGVEEGEEDTRWVTYDIITFGAAAAHAAPHGFHGGGILRCVNYIILIGLKCVKFVYFMCY
jgi:hypothetical protein